MHEARAFFFVYAGVFLLALLLPRPAGATWPTDPTVNVPVCTAFGSQLYPAIATDGAGGAIVTWSDGDIHAQRISADGTPLWTADGVALCTAQWTQERPTIVSDGGVG